MNSFSSPPYPHAQLAAALHISLSSLLQSLQLSSKLKNEVINSVCVSKKHFLARGIGEQKQVFETRSKVKGRW
jgi:hypothetical protein